MIASCGRRSASHNYSQVCSCLYSGTSCRFSWCSTTTINIWNRLRRHLSRPRTNWETNHRSKPTWCIQQVRLSWKRVIVKAGPQRSANFLIHPKIQMKTFIIIISTIEWRVPWLDKLKCWCWLKNRLRNSPYYNSVINLKQIHAAMVSPLALNNSSIHRTLI